MRSIDLFLNRVNSLQLEFLTAENEDLKKHLKLLEAKHNLMEREWEQKREAETKELGDKIELLERANSQLKVKFT